ncbi:DNA methylase, partial [bacterium]
IVDTVLVCRSTGVIPRRWLAETPDQLAALILDDLDNLKIGGLEPTRGDIRCFIYGHLARLAIWRLRATWNKNLPVPEKLAIVAAELGRGPTLERIESHLTGDAAQAPLRRYAQIREEETFYGERDDRIAC